MLEDEGMKSHRPANQSALVHLAAGGVGGTAGAIVTCPLEVIKTRLQSSIPLFRPIACLPGNVTLSIGVEKVPMGVLGCTRHIIKTEGIKSLFRGLGPNLVGVAPSRAIYFTAYAKTKSVLNNSGLLKRDSTYVHMLSALSAGVTSTTATSPIWVVKTRLQLDSSVVNRFGIIDTIREIYTKDGMKGFYRGLSASYFGVTETVIHLVIYERIKARINGIRGISKDYGKKPRVENFIEYMLAAGISKSIACTLTYPHEVVRTRLRQYEIDGERKYYTFLQTLRKVWFEEGARGLYGGLTTQLFRQIPNTGIIFLTYEIILSWFEG